MIKSVLDYMDITAARFPDKAAYIDEEKTITFEGLRQEVNKIASGMLPDAVYGEPVLVYMAKSVDCIEAFLAVRATGAFYVPIDVEMPAQRVRHVIDTCRARLIITRRCDNIPEELTGACKVLYMEDLLASPEAVREEELKKIRARQIDTDPIYAIFTSGSTGVPKGVLISERSAINFTEWYCETFEFTEEEIFANQTPFYFDASVKDIYATLRCGSTMYIVPQKLFSLPARLVQFLNDNKVNCIDWVPSVLCMIVNFRTFEKVKPQYLKKVMFLGEVMPTKQFNQWRRALPDIKYANLYGPTEATGDCTFYKVNREFADTEPIPIGNACNNTEVMLLKEDGTLAGDGETGEICVRGCSLALGYYNDPEKTAKAFTQNPLQKNYEEKIYHTGDMGRYNEYGEIVFVARGDSQIKHMGHRIELGEIETAVGSVDGVDRVCCMYNKNTNRIIAVYEGAIDSKEIIARVKDIIPRYMVPNQFVQLDSLPLNMNGKIDRALLAKTYTEA